MGYWTTIELGRERERDLNTKYGYEWVNFTPEPAYAFLNPFDLGILGDPIRKKKVLREFIISEGWNPADFRFRKGSNEGYIISIDVYDDSRPDYPFIGTVDFKFLTMDGARMMVEDLLDPDYE